MNDIFSFWKLLIASFVVNVKYSFIRKSGLSFYDAFMRTNNVKCLLRSLCDFDFVDNDLFFVSILNVIFTTNVEVFDLIDGLLKQITNWTQIQIASQLSRIRGLYKNSNDNVFN